MKTLRYSETSKTVYHLTLRPIAGDTNLKSPVLGRMISERAPVTGMYTLFTAAEVLANTKLGGDQFQILVPVTEN
jgi:hypothetical protein